MTDYKGLVKDLRHRSDVQRRQFYISDGLSLTAADAVEALLAERDALRAQLDSGEKHFETRGNGKVYTRVVGTWVEVTD